MKKFILAISAALLLCGAGAAAAITPFIITDIRVEGAERLEAGTVFNYLPLKVGDELNDEEARISIKELFRTGFFQDVALEQDGTVLVVKVVERPSISELTVSGNKALDSETLKNALEQSDLVEGRIFSSTRLEQFEQEIKNAYLSMGRYSASVYSQVEELERNRVAVTLTIDEGRVAAIKKINIIGADAISELTLRSRMMLRDARGLSLFTKRNQYSRQTLEADIETIRSYYLDRGFHDFEVISSTVSISPNKQDIFVSINIHEGDRFVFGDTVFEAAGTTRIEGLDEHITIERGKPFSRKVVNESRVAVAARYADEGYASVEVRPVFEADREALTIKTVFVIDPKQRKRVRRVEISGNSHTRDQVIRREMRQLEGAWYSAAAVARSKARLQRLGYFASVTIEVPDVPGTTDQVDVRVVVAERETGSISFSLGYSDTDGALIGATYSQRNLVGTGRELDVDLNHSDTTEEIKFSYIDPYHTPNGVSRGLSLSNREVDTKEVGSADYVFNASNVGVNYKIPIAETNSVNIGYVLENIKLEATSGTPDEIGASIMENPGGENLQITVGVSNDTRNKFFFPTSGTIGSLSLELTAPGSDFEYYKASLDYTKYTPITETLTSKVEISLGLGDSYGDAEDGLPFFKRYYAGGANSVRGYDGRSLGPRSADTADSNPTPLGGDKRVLVNSEVLFAPFGSTESGDKRFGLFLDGGLVFTHNESVDLGELRYTAGALFHWASPIGPFSMTYAVPLNDEEGDGDIVDAFQINFGTVFQ